MCLIQSTYMQNSPFYISKEFIAEIKGEEILQRYPNVTVHLEGLTLVEMILEVTSHRLLLKSNSIHSLLIKGQIINQVSISESGFFSKDYFVKLLTQFGKIKLSLKSYNQARINIDGMMKKKAWLIPYVQKKTENVIYTGVFDKINKEKQKINVQGQQINQSFVSFDKLFGNLRQIKGIMNQMKTSSGQSDGDNPEVNKILKDMGFVSVIDKDQAGKDYYQHLSKDLYQVCQNTLFKTFGGMVALLDLFYFYNKKRTMSLLSPQEILKACELFPSLGLNAKLVRYPNNIILVESTTFNPAADYQQNFAKYFSTFKQGFSSQEIARKKGVPVAIVDIKLRHACKTGKLAVSDRIEGIKYYKNMLLTV